MKICPNFLDRTHIKLYLILCDLSIFVYDQATGWRLKRKFILRVCIVEFYSFLSDFVKKHEVILKILITGASGLIGSALQKTLKQSGHEIFIMKRGYYPDENFYWEPEENVIHLNHIIPIDAVINLSGENLANKKWTPDKKQLIHSSRIDTTKFLVKKLNEMSTKPSLFISASAVGFYGEHGDILMDESAPVGEGFLAELCEDWESAANLPDARNIHLRFGIVLTPKGGMLKKLLLPFRLGLGAKLGDGSQYMSWVGLQDLCKIVEFVIDNEQLSGAINVVSPNPMTNAEFTRQLARLINRPAFLTLPKFLLKWIYGEMADETLLTSTRVAPKVLLNAGFQFFQTDISKIFKPN